MAVYKWKSGSRVKCSAQTAGEVCEKLGHKGKLTPEALVDASRSEDAPLHGAFEWNDETAAEKYRVIQAGYIIRSIEIETEYAEEPVRAFVPVLREEKTSYESIEVVMMSEDGREQLLSRAIAELRAFERKYNSLEELAEVFAAIKAVA